MKIRLVQKLAVLTVIGALGACGGGGGSDRADQPPPNNSGTQPDTITLHGLFDESFKDFPTVTVTVGEKSFPAEQINNNEFRVEIEADDENALVTISARGAVSDDWEFDLRSYVGSYAELKGNEISGEISYLNNNPTLVVGALSGVIADLIDVVNDGEPVTTIENLKNSSAELPMTEAVDVAAFLRAAIEAELSDDSGFYFPEDDYQDSRDFVQDFVFSSAWAAQQLSWYPEEPQEYIDHFTNTGYLRRQDYQLNGSKEIFLASANTATTLNVALLQLQQARQSSGNAKLADIGDFTLAADELGNISGTFPEGTLPHYAIAPEYCFNSQMHAFNARHVFSTAYIQAIKVDVSTSCEGSPGERYEMEQTVYLYTTDSEFTFPWNEIPTEFFAQTYHSPSNSTYSCCDWLSGRFVIDSGIAGTEHYGMEQENHANFSAQLDGELIITYDDGSRMRYIPQATRGKATRYIAVHENTDGSTAQSNSGFLVGRGSLDLNQSSIRLETAGPFQVDSNYALVYREDGRFDLEFIYREHPFADSQWVASSNQRGSWEVNGKNALLAHSYYDPALASDEDYSSGYVYSCEGQSAECRPWRRRQIELLDVDGDVYYVRIMQEMSYSDLDLSKPDVFTGYIGSFKATPIAN